MVDPNRFLDAGVQLHGHTCEAMLLGLRVGAAAMNRLGAERSADAQLLALVAIGEDERGRCVADGVQTITGCTLGKGNLRLSPGAPLGLTLVDRATGRAVRVSARVDVSSRPMGDAGAGGLRLLRLPEWRLLATSAEFDYGAGGAVAATEQIVTDLTGVKAGQGRGC